MRREIHLLSSFVVATTLDTEERPNQEMQTIVA
jgi:hypothetical protein